MPVAARSPSKHTPMPVLILDDERFDRHRLERLCSSLEFPCAVSNAKSLGEFSEILKQGSFGLILLDYFLPDGTGLDALEMVQLCVHNLNTPTLMVSGQVGSSVTQKAQAIGCAGFLSKDDLTAASFSRVVSAALGDADHLTILTTQKFDSEEVELLLSRCASRCARDVKPMVSRLLRQVRHLRLRQQDNPTDDLAAIEHSCLSLWGFLIEMEREDGASLISDLKAPQIPILAASQGSKETKPPSPFTSRRI